MKKEKFEPEHLGKVNFYLEALDRDVKKENENPSIGVLLCKDKDTDVVEYALAEAFRQPWFLNTEHNCRIKNYCSKNCTNCLQTITEIKTNRKALSIQYLIINIK